MTAAEIAAVCAILNASQELCDAVREQARVLELQPDMSAYSPLTGLAIYNHDMQDAWEEWRRTSQRACYATRKAKARLLKLCPEEEETNVTEG